VAIQIREYKESDASEIADLFHGSVHAIASILYTSEQKEAWAPTPPDYSAWETRLATKQPFVAVNRDIIVGFAELEKDGHIDCFYVHKNYQGLRIGSQLLKHLIQVAHERNIKPLYTEASKAAKPLFEKFGFRSESTNEVSLRGQILVNYNMVLVSNSKH